uniref:PawS-like protein 1b n=1 Tax=Melampodium paludosum TaxID=415156 RepID=A0A1V0JB72_9ASTR|nr:PawS-like protein 1b [Melampodium paludosum]
MAKLALLALTLTAVVAVSAVSAYRTTIITTEDNGGVLPNAVEPWIPFDALPNAFEPWIPFDALPNGVVPWIPPFDALPNGVVPWIPPFDALPNGVVPWIPPFDALDNRRGPQEQCSSEIPIQQLNQCQMHLTQGIGSRRSMQQEQQHLEQCCSQLKRVSERCQCEAIQQVFDEARQQGGVMSQMLEKARRLPTECRLDVQDCPIWSPRV